MFMELVRRFSNKTTSKINESNLLNFYLSSITTKEFNFKPNKNTKKSIWRYLNASNLIKLEDASDKERLKELELAASQGQLDSDTIFKIYQRVPFNLNELINAGLSLSAASRYLAKKNNLSKNLIYKLH